ncbi:MAG: BrnT family toxin [Alphaproteobacteria bacterium]
MKEVLSGFDWDAGNLEKCLKHGVSRMEIEALFLQPLAVLPDKGHSLSEKRLKAVGRNNTNRSIFLVFTMRSRNGNIFIRPISARYMHAKEIRHYEKDNPGL